MIQEIEQEIGSGERDRRSATFDPTNLRPCQDDDHLPLLVRADSADPGDSIRCNEPRGDQSFLSGEDRTSRGHG